MRSPTFMRGSTTVMTKPERGGKHDDSYVRRRESGWRRPDAGLVGIGEPRPGLVRVDPQARHLRRRPGAGDRRMDRGAAPALGDRGQAAGLDGARARAIEAAPVLWSPEST